MPNLTIFGENLIDEVYKNLDEVLACQGETIEILYRLRPIGVAMAGEATYDPCKD